MSRPSISWAKGLWLAAAALAVAVAAGVLVSIVRGDDGGPRGDVAAYIEQVNAEQEGLALGLARVNRVYQQFGRGKGGLAEDVPDLAASRRTLVLVRDRVRAIEPPPEAEELQRRIVRLLTAQAALAGEVTQLARYAPQLVEASQDVAAATERLRRGLAAGKTATAQQAAFARYAEDLDPVVQALAGARAPASLEGARLVEVARLRGLAALAETLRAALERGDATGVDDAARRLAVVSAGVGVARAQRQGALAYNRELRRLNDLRAAVAAEIARLQRELR